MILTGEVLHREVRPDPDGDGHILFLQLQVSDPDDIQELELMRHAGVDYNPVNESQVVIVEVSPAYRIAIASDDGIQPTADPGDYEIYGNDGSTKTSRVKCVNDGQLELNGTGDFAVRFDELKAAFDELKADFNALVSAYNGHTHDGVIVSVSGGSGTPGDSGGPSESGSSSSASIDAAKIDTIEVPNAS